MSQQGIVNLSVAYHTLGCKLNFAETSTIARVLGERGFRVASAADSPDVVVVNTCSVTDLADKKGRQLLRRLHRENPDALIVAIGCYAQLKPAEVAAIEGVDIVVGAEHKMQLADYIDSHLADRRQQLVEVTPYRDIRTFGPSCARGDRTRYFLKVQDGCDYWCSYCTIPAARGRSRSGSITDLVKQAEAVAAEGGKEIIITGVNIGEYGHDAGTNLLRLITELDRVEGIERFRISSIEPNLLSDDIIEMVAASRRFMPHFHIPLQCGSDEVLRLMRRRYDTALFAQRVAHIKRVMPDAFIGVDVIVGMRGETSELFEQSLRFCAELPISKLHVFPYSERPGTAALAIEPAVEQREKTRRSHLMLKLSDDKLRSFTARYLGTARPVLWEQPAEGQPMHGFTDNYLRCVAPCRPELINTITPARLQAVADEEHTVTAAPEV